MDLHTRKTHEHQHAWPHAHTIGCRGKNKRLMLTFTQAWGSTAEPAWYARVITAL